MLTQAEVTRWGQGLWQRFDAVGRGFVHRCELCWRLEPWRGCWRWGQRLCDDTCGEFTNRVLTESLYVRREGLARQVRLPWDTLRWWQRLGAWVWAWQHWGDPDHRLGTDGRGPRWTVARSRDRLWLRVLWADAWSLRLPSLVWRGLAWCAVPRGRRSVVSEPHA